MKYFCFYCWWYFWSGFFVVGYDGYCESLGLVRYFCGLGFYVGICDGGCYYFYGYCLEVY